jgi:cystathionine beta-lyase
MSRRLARPVRPSLRTMLAQPHRYAPAGFRSLVPPTWRGSTTLFANAESVRDSWDPKIAPYTYGLYGSPTTLELAERLRRLDGGYATLLTPGGQAAIALVDLSLLASGDHLLLPESIYGPSRELSDGLLRRLGISVEYYPPLVGARIDAFMRPNTRLVWCESPGSITFEIQDVPAIASSVHAAGALVAVDNTWAAGIHFKAIRHGADVVIQALTKYVGGHSDLLLGSVTSRDPAIHDRLGATHAMLGLGVSPDDCSLALRGLQTLPLRLDEIERTGLAVAQWLAARPEIERVLHPGLMSCPGHDIWSRDFSGAAGVFSFVFGRALSGAAVNRFINDLTLFKIGYSWGGVTSLVIPGARESTRSDYAYDHRLVRLSIGLEDPRDLIADLQRALNRLRERTPRSKS